MEKLDTKVADDLNLAWHRLDTWPDTVPGFVRLKRKYMLAPCSNGNIALMVDIARRNNIPWDAILGSEIARDFKPKPAVYLMTAAALNLQPHEVMMFAAHSDDLRQAASNGLRTAHVARPGENGRGPENRLRGCLSISPRRTWRTWPVSSACELESLCGKKSANVSGPKRSRKPQGPTRRFPFTGSTRVTVNAPSAMSRPGYDSN